MNANRKITGLQMIKWEEAQKKLLTLAVGPELDEYIDTLIDYAMVTPTASDMAEFFIHAFPLAQRDLTLRSIAITVAISASSDNVDAVDTLVASFRKHREHPFLAPALLNALALFSLKSPIAHAETASILFRLTCQDSRYLLIKAAQIIGYFDARRQSFDLRQKLFSFSTCSDLSVQAEVAMQQAFIELANTLISSTSTELYQRLALAQIAFARAGQMEEHRPDAELFLCLIRMLLTFHNLADNRVNASIQLQELISSLRTTLIPQWWPSYRSEAAEVCITHILQIADALQRAVTSVQDVEDWINMEEPLIELAALYASIRSNNTSLEKFRLNPHIYSNIADKVFIPQLGSLLQTSISRRRIVKVTENYVAIHGEDEYSAGLRAFIEVVTEFENTKNKGEAISLSSSEAFTKLSPIASATHQSPEALLQSFLLASKQGNDSIWIQRLGLGSIPLPIDKPEMFAGHSAVHEVVINILQTLKLLVDPYPLLKWQRLTTVIETIVLFAKFVFDTLPDFTKCQKDGGKGQTASEKDLQDALFSWLRMRFDEDAIYESSPLGGGRVDTGLQFPECKFPIEVKHEFTSIHPDHVRENYLYQADIYAATSDRISFLLILDLRASHASKRRGRTERVREGVQTKPDAVSLYSWQESFRVDTLPLDPQVPQARPKAIIIGTIPGNRPIPSHTTKYSTRPNSGKKNIDT
jgi:hypothetical protein